MCDWTIGLMAGSLAVSTLGIAMGAAGQQQQAEAANAASRRAAEANIAYQNQLNQLNIDMFEAQAAQAQASAEAQNEYLTALGKAQLEVYSQNVENALDAYPLELQALIDQEMETEAQASQQVQDIQRERAEKMGEMVASSKASGVNLGLLIGDYYRQEGRYVDAVNQNLEFNNRQIARGKEGRQVATEARIAGISRPNLPYARTEAPIYRPYVFSPVNSGVVQSGPDALTTGLKIGGSIFNTYTDFAVRTGKPGQPNWNLGLGGGGGSSWMKSYANDMNSERVWST